MKYKVRYEVEGFVESETFETEKQAKEYYDEIILKLGNWLLDINMWEVQ